LILTVPLQLLSSAKMPAIPADNLQQAITAIEEQAAQARKIAGIRFRRFTSQLDQIEKIVDDTISSGTTGLSDDDCKIIIERISARRGSLPLKSGVTT
jgi:hypothetical protein